MEDALAHVSEGVMVYRSSVLILVVMEDALAPAYSVLCHTANKDVLILVVMEDALALLTF